MNVREIVDSAREFDGYIRLDVTEGEVSNMPGWAVLGVREGLVPFRDVACG